MANSPPVNPSLSSGSVDGSPAEERVSAPPSPTAVPALSVDTVDDMASMSDEQLLRMLEESRIVIKKGGEVVIENLTPGLLEVAYELDPDNEGIQCRLEASQATPAQNQAPASKPEGSDA